MDSVTPLVSILVPVYKVEAYVERCAKSLFEQTYPNLEFLFVDDASPDRSIEKLQQVTTNYPKWKGHITIIHHNKNLGLAASRNTLVDNCKGVFLFHVDSDDWIEPNAIELLVKKQLETEADIVTGGFCRYVLNGDKEEILKKNFPLKEKDRLVTLKSMLDYGSVVATWNRLIRTSLYRSHNIRYVEGIDAGEDLLITPRLYYFSEKVSSCESITYHYNQSNSNSYVNLFSHSWEMQYQLLNATLLNVDFFKDKEAPLCEAMNKQLAQRLKQVFKLTFRNHNHQGYNTVLTMLDDLDRSYWPVIEWNRMRRRWLDHHYYIARLWDKIKKR